MCVYCGELISSFHWGDVVGSGVVILESEDNFNDLDFKESGSRNTEISNEMQRGQMQVGQMQGARLKSRLKKVVAANKILDFYGLKLTEWQNSKYVLSNKVGKSEIVQDLGDLWEKAALMCGKKLDVLDEKLLKTIQLKNMGGA